MSSEDRAALVALFRSTGGTRWSGKRNWDTDAELSQWYQVKVNQDGRVVELRLDFNNVEGTIPEALGALTELKKLYLHNNKLTGPIPEALGALTKITHLRLDNNKLTGPIPEALGALKELTVLGLGCNKLTGSVPTCLASLSNLKVYWLSRHRFVGVRPANLRSYGALVRFTETSSLSRCGNKLTGAPRFGESLRVWKARMEEDAPVPPTSHPRFLLPQQQQESNEGDEKHEDAQVPTASTPPVLLLQRQETGAGDEKEEDAQVVTASTPVALLPQEKDEDEGDKKAEDAQVPTASTPSVFLPQQQEEGKGDENDEDAPVPLEVVAESTRSLEHASLSPGKAEGEDLLFRAQLSSSAGLDSLITENPEAMEDIQRVIEATVAGNGDLNNQLSSMEGRRKLSTLVTMSTALGEVALMHTEDMDIQRKELALAPFSQAYYTAVRGGLCNAYLAASVIDSDWVSTSKTGGMGKAGAALKLFSSAVPVVGGLPELAGKALETGDHYLQTRRLVKITAMAPDVMECCFLARRLALELADGLRNDASATADDTDQARVHTTAGMKGGSGSGRGADVLPDVLGKEDVFEYVLEEVASYESNDHGGKRLGKQHIRQLLKAIQRGCLDGSHCTEQKIEVLLREILPQADVRPAATPSTPKEVIVRSPPVVAPVHDSGLPSRAEFAAMQAALEELQAAKDKQQEELKAMRSANKKLQLKVVNLEKHVPAPDCEPGDSVDVAGGLALRQRVAVTETAEGFLDRARDRAAAAADHHPVTVSELREFEALQQEKHREHDAKFRELEGEISKANKPKGRR